MNIKWHEVTWYSKLLAVVVLFVVVPFLAFNFGQDFENSPLALSPSQQTAAVASQTSNLLAMVTQMQSHRYPIKRATPTVIFTRTLKLGSTGSDVLALQNYLISKGFMVGPATNYFGKVTRNALITWQRTVGISPATGTLDAKSIKFLNNLTPTASVSIPTTTPTPTPTPIPSATPVTTGNVNIIFAVDNTLGGTANSSNFKINVIGGNPNPTTLVGSTVGMSVPVNAGTSYSVNALPLVNYKPVNSAGCSGNATAGITATCSIIDIYIPPTVSPNPATVTNLSVAGVSTGSVTLTFTEVNDGTGVPAKYDIRFAPGTISWGSAASVRSGTCASPMSGTSIGTTRQCTVTGLTAGTAYQFQLVSFRGTLNLNAIFGGLSNVASGMMSAVISSPTPSPTATISASPTSTTSGQSSTITWSSTNDTSCTASGGWTGARATSGTQSVAPTTNTTYSISCTGAGGTSSVQSTTVSVSAPVVSFSSQPIIYLNQNFDTGSITPFQSGATVTTEASHSGNYSAKMVVNNLATGPRLDYTYSNPSNPTLNPNGLYQQWYMMVPASTLTATQSGQLKLLLNRYNVNVGGASWLMLGVGAQFLGNNELAVWRDADTGRLPCNNGRADGSTGIIFQPGQWYQMETYFKRDPVTNLGQIKLWVNGQLVCSSSPDSLLGSSLNSDVLSFWLGGVYAQGNSGPATVYVDDVSASNSFINPVAASTVTTKPAPVPPPVVSNNTSSLYPNQPAGFTRFAELDMSTPWPVGYTVHNAGDPGCLNGTGFVEQTLSYVSVQSDGTAPQSPPGVLQYTFHNDQVPGMGGGGGLLGVWSNGSNESWGSVEYKELYESTWIKIPSADFETQSILVKIFGYWDVGNNDNTGGIPGDVYGGILGATGNTSLMSSWQTQFTMQGAAVYNGRNFAQNAYGGPGFTAGSWQHFEMYAKLNDIGSANGILKWWINGVLLGSYTDVTFIDAGHPSGFWGRRLDTVWGGQGGTNKTRDDHLWFDHMYLSGIPK